VTVGGDSLEGHLFPAGPPSPDEQTQQSLVDQYRLLVESSERVVARRQTANTFFLSINSALLVVAGVLLREGDLTSVAGGVVGAGLSVIGFSICFAWWRMVTSSSQLNRAKFRIIHLLEEHLPAAVFTAEWDALGRGQDPSLYRPLTGIETRVPKGLMVLYAAAALASLATAVFNGLG
jgi:hypothetical protein